MTQKFIRSVHSCNPRHHVQRFPMERRIVLEACRRLASALQHAEPELQADHNFSKIHLAPYSILPYLSDKNNKHKRRENTSIIKMSCCFRCQDAFGCPSRFRSFSNQRTIRNDMHVILQSWQHAKEENSFAKIGVDRAEEL